MRRSKLNAAAFLSGALLVGAVTGAAGNTWYSGYSKLHNAFRGPVERMYDDLELSCEQRDRVDSIFRARQMAVRAVNAPFEARADSVLAPLRMKAAAIRDSAKPMADSIRAASKVSFLAVMTATQRARYDQLTKEAEARNAEWEKQRPPDGRDQRAGPCGGKPVDGGRGMGRPPGPGGPGRGRGDHPGPPDGGRPRHPH